ncbi:PIN domain-containing protein [Sandaracinobacteroides saxicola]|uniref:PIN domain-containing protein n=1 Tax=Sandaracinobacteroides saxicola TaxID=2759707 RepID=A0A7G5IJL3_9SPHN|nr:PIN domain-containing protein [Sandaracinobacteroides saxicola]QMW23555.1 hypothetical protein H3309_03385 [Sandaracinobacteroides saxicola]
MSDLIIDANILLGSLFGTSMRMLRDLNDRGFALTTPAAQAEEVATVVPHVARHKAVPMPNPSILWSLVSVTGQEDYASFQTQAMARLVGCARDKDWPLLALAMAFNAPVMTRDRDLFGTGIVTWLPENIRYAEPETV